MKLHFSADWIRKWTGEDAPDEPAVIGAGCLPPFDKSMKSHGRPLSKEEADKVRKMLGKTIIRAPWTPDQVVALSLHQTSGDTHPFTCANRGDGKHPRLDGDHGILIPTVSGWVCQFCNYKQDWCHEFMTKHLVFHERLSTHEPDK